MNTLLAVDGSDHSYEAVRALKYLRRADELTLLHVVDAPRPAYPVMNPEVAVELYDKLERTMKEDGDRLLNHVQSLLPPHSGPVTKRLEIGSPADVIVTTAERRHVDLIVMGARGLGPVKERLFGSVSHRILDSAPCAKLILNSPLRDLKKVLLPLQGQADAEAALRFLQKQPFQQPVDVSLLNVLPSTRPPWPIENLAVAKMEAQALHHARAFLEGVAANIHALGHSTSSASVLGTPAATILQEAEKLSSDLIMMGSRGREGVTRFFLGSVSHAVLHQTQCPVLVFE